MKSIKFKSIAKLVTNVLDGKLIQISKENIYVILVPQGYEGEMTVYQDRIFYSLDEIAREVISLKNKINTRG